MNKIQLRVALVTGMALCSLSHAALLREVQFVGYGSGNLGASPETGSLEGWQNSTAQVTVTNGSGSLDGTSLGLVASEGDRAFASATTALNVRNFFVPANGTFPQTADTNLYFSFLYKFNNTADVTDGEVIMRMNRANSGTGTPQHWDLVTQKVGNDIQLGITKAGTPNATNFATTNISAGQTVFIVVRQHIIPGAQNDVYDLWINPPPQYFGTNDVDVPPSAVSIGAQLTDGTEDSSATGPGRLVFVSGVSSEFDEFRAATTWAEVTPWFGQCVNAGVAVSPTNVTQSAEISATMRVFGVGTSRTYQWQSSTNAGATWQTISGATASTYTTPNLPLALNGIRYRAIVSVACNSSSATSAVATVTLVAPTPSPSGLIVHDLFEDFLRDDSPFTVSNSLWYTANSANLDAFSNPGVMVGTPLPGSSSLWLGYFTETNTLPVHLAVGRSIKATLPFTANSYSSFTNNATLRIGLFDYYDSGNRVITDGANVGGSQGNAAGVRGYMLALDFGALFTDATPMEIFARNFLPDINLMGTTSDYESLGSGPASEVDTNAPAFVAGVPYTLEFTVARVGENSVTVTTSIAGNGTNWSHTVTDNNYAYHRFDAFGIRPNSLETSADSFNFSEFKVEVISGLAPVAPFAITGVQALAADSIKLTWQSETGASYHVLSSPSIASPTWTTNATVLATGTSTSYTNTPTVGAERFYRVVGLPYTP